MGTSRRIGRLTALAVTVSLGLAATTDGALVSAEPPPYTPTGTWLTDAQGRVEILRGVNVVDITPPITPSEDIGFGEDDAAFLAANGFNVVRLGVSWARLQPQAGVYDDAYLESLDQTVRTLEKHGITSLLDMHENIGPDWATGGPLPPSELPFPDSVFHDPAKNDALDRFWTNADGPNGVGLQDNYALMMQHLADRFKGDPAVIGIEIMNEPLPGNQYNPILAGSTFFEAQQLTPFYNNVVAAIRSVNPKVPVFFEPAITASLEVPVQLGTINDSNTVLSFHSYVYVEQDGELKPDTNVIADNALAYAKSHGIPAMMTEFGSTSNLAFIEAELGPSNRSPIGWTEWSYSDTTYGGVDGTPEWIVKDPRQSPTGHNVNNAVLKTLARPYAQVIAGIPGGFSLHDGTFVFSYSTNRADGQGTFPPGSQTVVAVPAIGYPGGYQATVNGGHVVSAPNAPELVVASDGGADEVSVTVSAK